MYERLEVEQEAVIVESSLLANIDWRLPVPQRYDLGMSDFVDASAFCKEDANPKPKGKEKDQLTKHVMTCRSPACMST